MGSSSQKKVIPVNLLNSPSRRTSDTATAPLWSKGFRPFFALAALYAVLFLPVWLTAWTGHLDIGSYWVGPNWHGHEMIFGFTIAVIAGFLLTAVGNWTGRETAVGPPLIALVVLWIAGRVAVALSGVLPGGLVAAIDLAFIPALAVAIGRPLLATDNRRNFMFLVILGAFGAANLAMHLDALGVLEGVARTALLASVDLTIFVTLVIGGRVIPMFTRNATGNDAVRRDAAVDRAVLVGMFLVGVTAIAPVPPAVAGGLCAIVGLLVFWRMRTWGTFDTLGQPILAVLHLGHAWIGVGLLLRAANLFGFGVAPTFATHVLTIGAIGTLTLGMMSRVALGHTGRELVVAPAITVAYGLVTVAVLARALLPVFASDFTWSAYIFSGAAFSAAFAIYLWKYLPILFSPRVA